MKPTKIFVHWEWPDGGRDYKLILGRKRAANYIRKLRNTLGVRIIWTVYYVP